MTGPSQIPPAIDPDNVPEVLCEGRLYLTWSGDLATLTFTHARPKAGPLLGSDQLELESIVRARVVMKLGNMIALRDLLNDKIRTDQTVPTGGATPETMH